MMKELLRYENIIGTEKMDEILDLVTLAQGKSIKMVNSTKVGGGVAEMLNRLVPLFNDIGVKTNWDVIKGTPKFFNVTKKMHNALQGKDCEFTKDEFSEYQQTNYDNFEKMIFNEDLIVIHDPQPCELIEWRRRNIENKWVWRCHIDMSTPNEKLWQYVRHAVNQYDAAIYTMKGYAPDLTIPVLQFFPTIDPLDDKNKELSKDYIDSVFKKYGIPRDKPIVTQISRYDPWKDPVGVIKAFKIARDMGADCRLLLVGDKAADDPETEIIMAEAVKAANGDPDIFTLLFSPSIATEINAFQRGSDIILQKSLKEGFALTVTEALWKSRPVIATNVGGIPKQVIDTKTGILCDAKNSIVETAKYIYTLLNSPWYGDHLGANGHNHVKENFLITENVKRYLELLLEE